MEEEEAVHPHRQHPEEEEEVDKEVEHLHRRCPRCHHPLPTLIHLMPVEGQCTHPPLPTIHRTRRTLILHHIIMPCHCRRRPIITLCLHRRTVRRERPEDSTFHTVAPVLVGVVRPTAVATVDTVKVGQAACQCTMQRPRVRTPHSWDRR